MELIIDSQAEIPKESLEYMNQALDAAMEIEGVNGEMGQISLTMVSSEEIRQLNKEYRQVDRVTDVLSFPQFVSPDEIPADSMYLLGDVVISMEQAVKQAEEYGHSTQRELVYLFVHSVFHLLGYDHMEEDEKKVMRQVEESVMKQIGLERVPLERVPLERIQDEDK